MQKSQTRNGKVAGNLVVREPWDHVHLLGNYNPQKVQDPVESPSKQTCFQGSRIPEFSWYFATSWVCEFASPGNFLLVSRFSEFGIVLGNYVDTISIYIS